MRLIEDIILSLTMKCRIEGPLRLEEGLFRLFLSIPEDPCPYFKGPTSVLGGRSKDHPRYGRWMHAFTKFYKPDIVVEAGTNAGGTAVGIAKALVENSKGRLICVDNGEGVPKTFPDIARANIKLTGLNDLMFELICEDSRTAIPMISSRLKGKVGIYLVDAAHTFEGALEDMEDGLPMMKQGGFIMVHDIDPALKLGQEASKEHPRPVLEAFEKFARDRSLEWCILKFIRKHLGVIKVN